MFDIFNTVIFKSMKAYSLIHLSRKIKSQSLKLLGVLFLHFIGRRHLSIRIDPAMNCNLFCKMCYFSNVDYRKKNKGIIPEEDFNHIARVLFPKAFQVYIGCGAEPTTHRGFISLIRLAKQYKVPDIGMVTNGQLITEKQIKEIISLQIDEITISCHGLTQETYEYFMLNAKFERFISLLNDINKYKRELNSPKPEIRLNYTVNKSNLKELSLIKDFIKKHCISTIQIRPSLNIGGTYNNPLTKVDIPVYNNSIEDIKSFCHSNKIRLLANNYDITYEKTNTNKKVAEAVYCYIGPKSAYTNKFNWNDITFKQFIKITKWRSNNIRKLFTDSRFSINKAVGNYDIFE